MNEHLREQTGRRREAIDRLRSLTTGAVVAGAAGTIGFGFLAAATFRGNSTAADATSPGSDDATTPPAVLPGSVPNQRNGGITNPGTNGLGAAPTPRPAGRHQGHAATGGSG
jgi:hypothetical protein